MGDILAPPHPVNTGEAAQVNAANRKKGLYNSLFIPHRRRLWGERTFSEGTKAAIF
jgi:hypothetical protein